MNPTIYDVARRASVSISTVSRVVNWPESVRKDKRERVLQVIAELGYEPNPFASGLRDRKTMTLAAFIPDISNPFFSELLRGIEDVAHESHYNVMTCNTDRNPQRFVEYMRYFRKKKVDGMVFASDPVTAVHREQFEELGVPVVLVATMSQTYPFPYVKVDDFQASYDAATFLIRNGHRELGIISGPLSDPIAGLPRYEGFRRAIVDAGLVSNARNEVFAEDFRYESGQKQMMRLYARAPDVTAVFAASDMLALGAIAFLQQRGIRVPADLSVMGFDNLSISHLVFPALTTVCQPIYEIGQVATKLLMQSIDHAELSEQVAPVCNGHILEHEIVVRDTVARVSSK